jgi:hypothetical protein
MSDMRDDILSIVGQKYLSKLNKSQRKQSLKQTKVEISGSHSNKYEVSSGLLHSVVW